jgi:Protein of unknown function (DUF2950)
MPTLRILATLIILNFALIFSGCSAIGGTSGDRFEQQRFDTPQNLVAAVKMAADTNDSEALLKILGPDGKNLLFSGDPVLDRMQMSSLSKRLAERADLVPYVSPEFPNVSVMKLRIGKMALNAGLPLVNEGNGWRLASRYFAPRSLKQRIAKNEIEVWRACLEYVEAQKDYKRSDWNGDGTLEYAQKFISSPGTRDGLYWKTAAGERPSPLSEVITQAQEKGYVLGENEGPTAFHGYIFKILTSQGKSARDGKRDYIVDGKMTNGFALIAYPVEWSVSGLRSFIVGPDGIVLLNKWLNLIQIVLGLGLSNHR